MMQGDGGLRGKRRGKRDLINGERQKRPKKWPALVHCNGNKSSMMQGDGGLRGKRRGKRDLINGITNSLAGCSSARDAACTHDRCVSLERQKRPNRQAKETYEGGKRDLLHA